MAYEQFEGVNKLERMLTYFFNIQILGEKYFFNIEGNKIFKNYYRFCVLNKILRVTFPVKTKNVLRSLFEQTQ